MRVPTFKKLGKSIFHLDRVHFKVGEPHKEKPALKMAFKKFKEGNPWVRKTNYNLLVFVDS